ncbi:hypothetical protein BGZ99_005820 [Dissophora globulifera]|uniref:Uncharacterized protein n=1 Tax=Dissophora globulifera TaxID=979702 RepID=A0A9P6RGL4_9FUNG|nr:hypothetical protein BGZ99_005820 [Dissophora globulifera]
MSLLRANLGRSFYAAQARVAAPATAAVLPHWNRSFSISTPSDLRKVDVFKTAPGWDPLMATESEADVKADREGLPKNMKQFQRRTIELLHEMHGINEKASKASKSTTPNGVKHIEKKIDYTFDLLEDELGSNSKVLKKGEEVVDNIVHRAQEAGANLGETAGTVKDKVGQADMHWKAGETVSEFVKDSIQTVKKTMGLSGSQTEEKIKKKGKNVDDKMDTDRGA